MYSSCSNIYIYLYRHIKFQNGCKMYIYIYTLYADFSRLHAAQEPPQKSFLNAATTRFFEIEWNPSKLLGGNHVIFHHGYTIMAVVALTASCLWVIRIFGFSMREQWIVWTFGTLTYLEVLVLGFCWYCRSRNFFPHCQLANATFMLASVRNLGDRSSL